MRRLTRLLVVAIALAATNARAADPDAVRHFHTGVALFKEGNYNGALAEFEEANRLKPSASALQNIALCQKALFRYADAIATLQRMIDQYGASLSADDSNAAKQAIAELADRVTKVTFAVTPPDATLTVDGRSVDGAGERTIHLDVGEHHVVAEGRGFRRFDQTVTIAGKERRVEVALAEDAGELSVRTGDPEAAINVDGQTRGYGTWTGKVTAGEHHTIVVYKPNHDPTTLDVVVATGEKKDVDAKVGEFRPFAGPTPFPYQKPKAERKGPYGFLTIASFTPAKDVAPARFVNDSDSNSAALFGVRGGYMLLRNWGIEGMIQGGTQTVHGCYGEPTTTRCTTDSTSPGNTQYQLTYARIGANARFLTNGETLRFAATAGLGAVSHTIKLPAPGDPNSGLPSGTGTAVNAYGIIEVGGELSISRVLVDLMAYGTIDGIDNLTVNGKSVFDRSSISGGGVALAVGYSLW